MKIFACDKKWLDVSDATWLAAFLKKLRDDWHPDVACVIPELIKHFDEIVGESGACSHPAIPVVHRKGRRIAPHRHPEHLIIYYPIGHPCRLMTEFGNFTPVKNSAVYLPPNTLHSVEANTNKKVRLSLALRWATSDD